MENFLLLSIGLVSTAFLTWIVKQYALKNSLLDIPNDRSSHKVSTPRGGGLAIVVVFLFTTLYLLVNHLIKEELFLSLFVGGLLVAVIGFWDDHHSLGRKWRFIIHLFAAIWLFYWAGGLSELPFFSRDYNLGIAGNIIGVIALVWLLNLYNFMDGIDGIAAVEAISVGACAALLLYLNNEIRLMMWLLSLLFACLGFLVWNWPPAKIFMGDVGSGFLGVTLGGFALITSNLSVLTVWTWLILLGVFLVDATKTLVARIIRGAKWYEAHRSHAYQHAAIKYNSHKKVTLAILLINAVWLFPWAWLSVVHPGYGIVFMLLAYVPLVVITFLFGAGKDLNDCNT